MKNSKKICVMGLGYIGLPTAALLANKGYQVHGVDVVESTVNTINNGEVHIVEPDLDSFVHAAVNSGHLKASLTPAEADVFIVAVPTPFHKGHIPNIDYIESASKAIAPFIKAGNLVILESTSPVGTTEKMADFLQEAGVNTEDIYISHCPERVLPGRVMVELVENDRIVGGLTPEATQKTVEFYRTFVIGEVLETNARTAEMAKLTENSSRDVQIAFANELSMLCDKFDINVWELINLANHHPRVNILQPGAGVGGHCIAVDPWFIVHAGGDDAKIIKQARMTNNYKSEWVKEKIENESLRFENTYNRKPIVAIMGLAFKPNIDDLRESPALKIATALNNSNAVNLIACEPNIESSDTFSLVTPDEAVEQADIIAFLVSHREFSPNLIPEGKKALDFCGVLKV
jgi:UDP-N-acetyl-D-mannosaminuronic acid dehydrogenase